MDSKLDKWSVLFDEFKEKESLPTDAKLADFLGVSRGYICAVRKGRKNLSIDLAKIIFDRLGRLEDIYSFNELFVPIKVRTQRAHLKKIQSFVKIRAQGHCQLCHARAPFDGPDGMPYLELHLIKPAKKGGRITPENMIALCPNCHRKVDVCPSPDDIEKVKKISMNYFEKLPNTESKDQ